MEGVVIQDNKVVAYTSSQLRPHERNYTTHDLELWTIVHTLKTWCHYLYRVQFEVYMDHKLLTYLFSRKDLNFRQRRWMKFLVEEDLQMKYHPGKVNVVVDTLNRKTYMATTSMSIWNLTLN